MKNLINLGHLNIRQTEIVRVQSLVGQQSKSLFTNEMVDNEKKIKEKNNSLNLISI